MVQSVYTYYQAPQLSQVVCCAILMLTIMYIGEYKIVFCLGTLQLENSDGLNFTYEDLFCMQISNTEKVLEIKERLTSKLAEHNPSIIVTPETIRLRERNALHPGQARDTYTNINLSHIDRYSTIKTQ